MKPTTIEGANLSLNAPAEWRDGELGKCESLHLRQDPLPGSRGVSIFSSAWELSDEGRARVAAGDNVVLSVIGSFHPVVAIAIAEPAAKPDTAETIVRALIDAIPAHGWGHQDARLIRRRAEDYLDRLPLAAE